MSWKMVQLVLEAAPVTDARTLLALVALAEWSQDDGVSWHGLPALAKRIRASLRTTQVVIKRLREPDSNGYTLLEIRYARNITYYGLNVKLLERLRLENNGQQNMFKGDGNPVEKNRKGAAACAPETQPPAPPPQSTAPPSAANCAVTITEPGEPELKPEPEVRPPASTEATVENPSLENILAGLARKTGFPVQRSMTDAEYEERRKTLDRQSRDLRITGTGPG